MKKLISLVGLLVLLAACGRSPMTESEALDFLYAYMPLPDQVDYDSAFWRKNVQTALQARAEMPWGDAVPEREWKHFVLPVRVNNERLDSSRWVFYAELRDRVSGLSMEEAILEVNHWCHEHVTYQPSDERTSSPLATVRSAIGRCGEESTFTVAALRSVGIPARQVYTPRWAHTDDNHAWVEAWADGRWHFLGACEPEAVLDLGWFNAPASRGMLMHTKVFGAYDGPEAVMSQNDCYTEISVTQNYAPVATAWVRVVDEAGAPVTGADVAFKLYNYAEFYTVAKRPTDARGLASLEAGLGDLVAWTAVGDRYGLVKCSVAAGDTATLVLDKRRGERYSLDLDLTPPRERNTVPALTDEQKARNAVRFAYEDSLRRAYEATFDTSSPLLAKSRGNHATLRAFLAATDHSQRAQDLLAVVSDKDLRDIELRTLRDAYDHTPLRPDLPADFYNRYVLCPRVANEMVLPHRALLSSELKGDVPALIQWVKQHIALDPARNPQRLRMTPAGVWRHRAADAASRDIFFVAACRANGWPARIDPVTGQLQVADPQCRWTDVNFEQTEATTAPRALLRADYEAVPALENPRYYSHFSLSRLADDMQLLNYAEDDTYASLLRQGTEVEWGDYLLVTGTRLAGGDVLAHLELFPVTAPTTVPLRMRVDTESLRVIGSLDSEALYTPLRPDGGLLVSDQRPTSLLSTTGRGYYVVALLAPDHEPSNHILRDLSVCKAELEAWGRPIVLLFRSRAEALRFRRSDFPDLPATVTFGVAEGGPLATELAGALPVVKIADTFNRVVLSSEGYTIGMGETLVKSIQKLTL
ncbi:MAG: transglutaminase domain-containing protein [Bacteroidaceae bacterium]|nr:transglutaminase domain-containing protein [Bacteroidaceae bacterium]